MLITVILIILIALVFDFLNGFHDAANAIATIVSTRVLTPLQAVCWAAFFNFAAAFTFGVGVASTIGKGVVRQEGISQGVILGALLGAIAWNIITWYLGLPTSSSHALIGGFAGAAVTKAGFGVLILQGLGKICLFIVLSPLIGWVLGFSLMVLMIHLFWNASPSRVNAYFRRLQLVSAGLYSLGHGTNDAQKTMGIIAILLYTSGHTSHFHVPFWVIFAAYTAIALGTLAGGWRIVKTMGMRITKLKPIGGFCAETAAAISIIGTALGGIPVSTTHTIAGAIMGVGSTNRLSAVRWGVAQRIVWAWILTIPLSALMASGAYLLLSPFLP